MPLDHDALAAVIVLAMKNAVGPLVAELADLRLQVARLDDRAPVAVPAGERGERGAPGRAWRRRFGFDEFAVEHDGDRTLTLAFARGAERKTFPAVLSFPRFRGEYQTGRVYAIGDVIRHGGSAWHCDAPTTLPPADHRTEWSLMVRRGRDGKSHNGARA